MSFISLFWRFSCCSFPVFVTPWRPTQGNTVTFGAEIVHQNDLFEEVWWRSVEHTVHRAEERGPHFIHETENHTGGRQVIMDHILCTPGEKKKKTIQLGNHNSVRWENVQKATHVSGLVSGMARSTGIWSLR